MGKVMIRPLSQSGDVTLYLWPLRVLKSKMGGPTFGVDVKGEEVLRFDPHGPRGHWHKGGYDKLGAGGSHTEFPDGLVDTPAQISWALGQIRDEGQTLLEEAGKAVSLDGDLVEAASQAIMAHLEEQGDLRPQAIAQGVLEA
ncbi:MAG: hypothetical protein IIC99_11435 [Chloroflexi bacterium]|nr:hypothetical protein [Chloroflexota bacterium]